MWNPARAVVAHPGRALLAVLGAFLLGWFLYAKFTFPSDRTPEGAYLRVVIAVNRGRPQDFFAYLETRAQHACYSIREYRAKARERVLSAYPEPERSRRAQAYAALAETADGSDVFAIYARERGWLGRLRRDLSGVARVQIEGERATVETARGTRYPLRLRPENGIWGLTLFTAELVAESERAARDLQMIEKAALDYERASHSKL
ncbi:MAG TPA: hypothetical protein VER33_21170 [Polyangiaceae bacterium]|nr:hypothetical protein [Polyangiaceae bacterium]